MPSIFFISQPLLFAVPPAPYHIAVSSARLYTMYSFALDSRAVRFFYGEESPGTHGESRSMVVGNAHREQSQGCEQRRFRRKAGSVSRSERFWRRAFQAIGEVKRQNSYLCARPYFNRKIDLCRLRVLATTLPDEWPSFSIKAGYRTRLIGAKQVHGKGARIGLLFPSKCNAVTRYFYGILFRLLDVMYMV